MEVGPRECLLRELCQNTGTMGSWHGWHRGGARSLSGAHLFFGRKWLSASFEAVVPVAPSSKRQYLERYSPKKRKRAFFSSFEGH